jgi:hypothetical protein
VNWIYVDSHVRVVVAVCSTRRQRVAHGLIAAGERTLGRAHRSCRRVSGSLTKRPQDKDLLAAVSDYATF